MLNTETSEILFTDREDTLLGTGGKNANGENLVGNKLMTIRDMFQKYLTEDSPEDKKWLVEQVNSLDNLFNVPVTDESQIIRDKLSYGFVRIFYMMKFDDLLVNPISAGRNTLIEIKRNLAKKKELSVPTSVMWSFVKILKGYLTHSVLDGLCSDLNENDVARAEDRFKHFITCMVDELQRAIKKTITWDMWIPKMLEVFKKNSFFMHILNLSENSL